MAIVLATLLMILSKTLHPPGGATALIAPLGEYGYSVVGLLVPANSLIIVWW